MLIVTGPGVQDSLLRSVCLYLLKLLVLPHKLWAWFRQYYLTKGQVVALVEFSYYYLVALSDVLVIFLQDVY